MAGARSSSIRFLLLGAERWLARRRTSAARRRCWAYAVSRRRSASSNSSRNGEKAGLAFASQSSSSSSSTIWRLGMPPVSPLQVGCPGRSRGGRPPTVGNASAKRRSVRSRPPARAALRGAPSARAHHLGAVLLAVHPDEIVHDLVDQAHRVDLARLDRPLGIVHQIALLVHLLGEHAGGAEVGEDDVAGDREQRVVELVSVPRPARDVELKGCHHSVQARVLPGASDPRVPEDDAHADTTRDRYAEGAPLAGHHLSHSWVRYRMHAPSLCR